MMNERGFISLVAILIMFIISMSIIGVTNLAAKQASIYNYSRLEVQLQNAAESCFNEVATNLINNPEYYGNFNSNQFKSFDMQNNDIKVKIFLKKYLQDNYCVKDFPNNHDNTYVNIIFIRALAESPHYNYAVYKRVYGYIRNAEIIHENGQKESINYEFNGYFD